MSARYTRLFSLPENQYQEGSPLLLGAGALLTDTATGKILAQLKFTNLSPKKVQTVKVKIHAFDAKGAPLPGVDAFTYKNLNAPSGGEFGAQTPIPLPKEETRSFKAEILSVLFADGSTYTSSTEKIAPAPKGLIQSVLGANEKAKQKKFLTFLLIPLVLGGIYYAIWFFGSSFNFWSLVSVLCIMVSIPMVCAAAICADANRKRTWTIAVVWLCGQILYGLADVLSSFTFTVETWRFLSNACNLLSYITGLVILVLWKTNMQEKKEPLSKGQKLFAAVSLACLVAYYVLNILSSGINLLTLLTLPAVLLCSLLTSLSKTKNKRILLCFAAFALLNAGQRFYSYYLGSYLLNLILAICCSISLVLFFLQYLEAKKVQA